MEHPNCSIQKGRISVTDVSGSQSRRARALGIAPGVLPPGPLNAITDVADVHVGQVTLVEGDDVRTGATAILPHGGNLLQNHVPAGLSVANGHGKMIGGTQIVELGEIETPILLTNTLAVPRAAEAILDWTLAQADNEKAVSINPVVGETNDGRLNAIEKRALTVEQILRAIEIAVPGPVEEGCVGAGTGTVAMAWKAGIGTSSRVLPEPLGAHTVGVLVQSNFPGSLQVLGVPIGRLLGRQSKKQQRDKADDEGSIMIVVATDALDLQLPLRRRNNARPGWEDRRGSPGRACPRLATQPHRLGRGRTRVTASERDRVNLFDAWAERYDRSIARDSFPLTGYDEVLDAIVRLAEIEPDHLVLDVGIGTANLAKRITVSGCELWGVDFSEEMLRRARAKLPSTHLVKADLLNGWPEGLPDQFDRIVSAYVFHEFADSV